MEEKPIREFRKNIKKCKECLNVRRNLKCCYDLGYIYWEYSNGMTERVGNLNNGYLRFGLNGKSIYVHRYLYEQYHNIKLKQDEYIDHMDRNRLNNCIENLRVVNNQQNSQNRSHRKNCSSKFKGVCFYKRDKKWHAYLDYNKKRIHIGYFDNEIEAAEAYNKKAIEFNENGCVFTLNIL